MVWGWEKRLEANGARGFSPPCGDTWDPWGDVQELAEPSRDGDGPGGKLGSGSCYWALACIHVYTRMESLHGRVHRGSKELTWLEEQAH